MGLSKWYVVQVTTGSESQAADIIRRVAHEAELAAELEDPTAQPPKILDECFVPTTEYERKRQGQWHKVTLPLFPGYLIVVTRRPNKLQVLLRGVPRLMRLLTVGESFVPLTQAEREWIDRFADQNHSVQMSKGVMEGDHVVVTSGPLKGQEALISRIDRRRGYAYLEHVMFGRPMQTRVGLAVVSGKDSGGFSRASTNSLVNP